MPRRHGREPDVSDAGQDSFLDTLTNIVGILILLVMVVAARAKNAPVLLSIPGPAQRATQRELDQELQSQETIHREILETADRIREAETARRQRLAERARLSLLRSAAEKTIEKRREELDAGARLEYDRRRQLAAAKAELGALENEYELASRLPKEESVRIENYPTPLSRTVHGPELHLQLRGGRITVVPMDEAVAALKAEFERNINRMRFESEIEGKIGPIGGFRVTYLIRRHDVSMRTYEQTGAGGSYVRLERFSLVPVSPQMGETFGEAARPGSEFREALSRCRPGRTTITIWVYADGFEVFRQLRKELHGLGFETAGRPMPDGELIGGSPEGSRSAAQ